MLISEIYHSRQGEGQLTGTPSVFVRTSGCNLRCSYCDTPFASWNPEGEQLSVAEIVDRAIQFSSESPKESNHVVVTGGEPMMPREIPDLCRELRSAGLHITVETAGTIFRDLDCDLMSISPKFSNSDPDRGRAGEWLDKHRSSRQCSNVVRQLMDRYEYQLKFVVDTPADLDEILAFIDQVQPCDHERVLLMPQGVTEPELADRTRWLVPIARSNGFTFCPRKHIEWFGNKRGT